MGLLGGLSALATGITTGANAYGQYQDEERTKAIQDRLMQQQQQRLDLQDALKVNAEQDKIKQQQIQNRLKGIIPSSTPRVASALPTINGGGGAEEIGTPEMRLAKINGPAPTIPSAVPLPSPDHAAVMAHAVDQFRKPSGIEGFDINLEDTPQAEQERQKEAFKASQPPKVTPPRNIDPLSQEGIAAKKIIAGNAADAAPGGGQALQPIMVNGVMKYPVLDKKTRQINYVDTPPGAAPIVKPGTGNAAANTKLAGYVKQMDDNIPTLQRLVDKISPTAVDGLANVGGVVNRLDNTFVASDQDQEFTGALLTAVAGALHQEAGARLNHDQIEYAKRRWIPIAGDSPAKVHHKLEQLLQKANEQRSLLQSGAGATGNIDLGNPQAAVHPLIQKYGIE